VGGVAPNKGLVVFEWSGTLISGLGPFDTEAGCGVVLEPPDVGGSVAPYSALPSALGSWSPIAMMWWVVRGDAMNKSQSRTRYRRGGDLRIELG
jgi:hypothetical protein